MNFIMTKFQQIFIVELSTKKKKELQNCNKFINTFTVTKPREQVYKQIKSERSYTSTNSRENLRSKVNYYNIPKSRDARQQKLPAYR